MSEEVKCKHADIENICHWCDNCYEECVGCIHQRQDRCKFRLKSTEEIEKDE